MEKKEIIISNFNFLRESTIDRTLSIQLADQHLIRYFESNIQDIEFEQIIHRKKTYLSVHISMLSHRQHQ